jgi:hypothetical protein
MDVHTVQCRVLKYLTNLVNLKNLCLNGTATKRIITQRLCHKT